MTSPLEIDSLSYSYDEKKVLEEISFSLRPGEILGILGPNGCGKTTLLKNLNRNLRPHGGCVLLDGDDIEKMDKRDIARRIASVPQTNEIRFAFTVREIVEMGRMPFQEAFRGNSSEDERIVEEAMEQAGVTDMADRYINTMSGGERQRTIIARALARLSAEKGLTVVIVSHDLPMVARYCDRMVLIHDHKVFAMGTPEEVLTPENMRTVFNIDARFETDERGNPTVRLFGAYRG